MNQGSFDKNCELLLIHITNLQQRGSLKICKATTHYLAKAIQKSERQVYRYLKALEEQGLIRRDSSILMKDPKKNNKLFKLRTIKSFAKRNHKTGLVMDIFFDESLSKKEKKKITSNILANDFECVNITSSKELARLKSNFSDSFTPKAIPVMTTPRYRQLPPEMIDDKIARMKIDEPDPVNPNNLTLEELRKICDEEEERLAQKREHIDVAKEKRAKEITSTMPTLKNNSDSELQKLAEFSISEHRRISELMESIEPPSYEEKLEKMRILAQNSKKENGVYVTTILLRGEIPYEVKLLDYVHWNKDSDYFEIFEREFNNK